jgi:hypothetical protein
MACGFLIDTKPLEVPDAIDAIYAQKLKSEAREIVKGNIEDFYPEVVLSYASGQRPGDEKGTGPGFVQAFDFITHLNRNGHMCFSGLHVPVASDWRIYFLRLSGKKAKAKVFIALLNRAYFRSVPCMHELHLAIKAKVKIVLVRMEDNIPPPQEDQWDGEMNEDDALERMVVIDYLGKKNAIPHPGTLLSVPTAFLEILKIIREQCKPDAPTNNGCFVHGSSSEQESTRVQVTALVTEAERREHFEHETRCHLWLECERRLVIDHCIVCNTSSTRKVPIIRRFSHNSASNARSMFQKDTKL